MNRRLLVLAPAAVLAACQATAPTVLDALPPVSGGAGAATARVDGPIGSTERPGVPLVALGTVRTQPGLPPGAAGEISQPAGDISLDFVDMDVREIAAQVLGTVLHVNYTIDPAVRGTATLRTVNPIPRSRVLPTLQAVLAQGGATLVESGGLYRVAPIASVAATPGLASGPALAGSTVVPLRYAAAEDLAKLLQPYAGATGKVVPDPGRNAILISGDPGTREALLNLIQAFDIDVLAGQSYALFPVGSGSAKDFATAMQDAMRSGQGAALAGVVRVVPMERINAVLLVSAQPRYIDDARRVYALVERTRRQTVRGWSVFYLQNSKSNDVAYVLQQAFTPNRVTAVPSARATGAQARRPGNGNNNGFNSNGGGGLRSGGTGLGGGGLGGGGLGGGLAGGAATPTDQPVPAAQNPANPLLGGLEPGGATGAPTAAGGAAGEADLNAIRIIPNAENNAVLVYATPQEHDTIEAMLHKIDILPLQVRIDAVIAEVTLNDNLSYGTQFFFKGGGINGALNFSGQGAAANALLNQFPGFVLGGNKNETYALSALQNVTTVKVLSSPQLMVLDNESARLQVGNLVPYLTSSSQSTLVANSAVINSVDYRETGVIMEVTPRVNSGGLVTLDISQEVSDVDQASTASSPIQSPTFLERNVRSRVVVQDGQTVGLAGLIRDSSSRGNSGIPWLKDIPLLGFLAGQQTNQRGRTELLVLVTPHVIHDQRDARALTEDLRDQLINAAAVPQELSRTGRSGSPDPQRPIRRGLRLER